ncbi:nucleoside phosphatase family-domain-containing protein [Hysterangium stoloniferum]|nr:nucleoside phosphatase family-domain-containing protein [Hysterangium stoloniferum]
MIDAGSQGSRIHIYKFHNCRAHPEYEYEVFKMTKPGSGLSKFADNTEEAARSLGVLMAEAVKTVPEKMKKYTPMAEDAWMKFPFTGIYAWITANYLLDPIRLNALKRDSTYAVLELGGASTQIVFEPTFIEPGAKFEEGDHKYHLEFSGRSYVLSQHSYLGYGLMQARKSVHRLLDFLHSREKETESEHVANLSLAQSTERRVEIDDGVGPPRNVTFVGADVGSFEACNRVMQLVMAKHEICHMKPCSFNGVYQPFSQDSPPDPSSSSPTSTTGSRPSSRPPNNSLHRYNHSPRTPDWGMSLGEREVRIAKQVEGTGIGWCLRATIVMLDRTKLIGQYSATPAEKVTNTKVHYFLVCGSGGVASDSG